MGAKRKDYELDNPTLLEYGTMVTNIRDEALKMAGELKKDEEVDDDIEEEKENILCIKKWIKDEIKLAGLRDNKHLNRPHTFIKVRMHVCNNQTLSEDKRMRGVTCETRENIDKWRHDKNLLPISFENSVNFDKGDRKIYTNTRSYRKEFRPCGL